MLLLLLLLLLMMMMMMTNHSYIRPSYLHSRRASHSTETLRCTGC